MATRAILVGKIRGKQDTVHTNGVDSLLHIGWAEHAAGCHVEIIADIFDKRTLEIRHPIDHDEPFQVLDLSHLFGEKYEEYARRTPLFWPDFSLFRWGQVQVVSRKALLVTIRDALFILAMIPFSEFVEHLRKIGLLPMAITVL
ncbi:hypothetical protein [Rhizobium nepotum]|uniref:hypothetical protein n=1 Tax=Rhizobium nepotum TaxID=1035271 RepID=UPI003CEFF1A1